MTLPHRKDHHPLLAITVGSVVTATQIAVSLPLAAAENLENMSGNPVWEVSRPFSADRNDATEGQPSGLGTGSERATTPATENRQFTVNGKQYLYFGPAFQAALSLENPVITVHSGDFTIDKEFVVPAGKHLQLLVDGSATLHRAANFTGSWLQVNGTSSLEIKTTGEGTIQLEGTPKGNRSSLLTVAAAGNLHLMGKITFQNQNSAGNQNGSCLSNNGITVIEGVTFNGNSAGNGGAIFNGSTGKLTLKQTHFLNNTALKNGGSLYNQGELEIKDSVFDGGKAAQKGGALALVGDSQTKLEKVTFPQSIWAGKDRYPVTIENNAQLFLGAGVKLYYADSYGIFNQKPIQVSDLSAYDYIRALRIDVHGAAAGQTVVKYTGENPDELFDLVKIKGSLVRLDPKDKTIIRTVTEEEKNKIKLVEHPYQDKLGFQPDPILTNPAEVADLRQLIIDFYAQDASKKYHQKYLLSELEQLEKQAKFVSEHAEQLKNTEITLSQLGNPNWYTGYTQQSLAFDTRDFLGLFVTPKVSTLVQENNRAESLPHGLATIDVFVDKPGKIGSWAGVQLLGRQVGHTNGTNSASVRYQSHDLNIGYNRVVVDAVDSKSLALYVRNMTADPVKIRVQAHDVAASAGKENADPTQPNSAAPIALGTQLGIYPVYQDNPNQAPGRFWDFLQYQQRLWADYKKQTGGKNGNNDDPDPANNNGVPLVSNMADYRFGRQDISTRLDVAADAYRDFSADNAEKHLTEIRQSNKYRLDALAHYDGFDLDSTNKPNGVNPSQVVLLTDDTVWQPSTMYANEGYYHASAWQAKGFLTGNYGEIMSWGHNHELGHMEDNLFIVIPEMTNNVYSMNAGFAENLRRLRAGQPGMGTAVVHPHMIQDQKDADAYLNAKIRKPEEKFLGHNGRFETQYHKPGANGVFFQTMTIFNAFRYFEDYDYSKYPFGTSPYTKELAEQVQKYGAWGTAMRELRRDPGIVRKVVPGGDRAARINRIIVLGCHATGYNLAQYFEQRGFDQISVATKEYCGKYPDQPKGIFYAATNMELVRQAVAVKKEKQQPITKDPGKLTVTVTGKDGNPVTGNSSSEPIKIKISKEKPCDILAVYEIYAGEKLIGFTRGDSLEITDPSGINLQNLRAVALDYRGNPTPKTVPWKDLTPAQETKPKKVPWVDLVPPKKVPWTELQPPKKVPWVDLVPPKKVPWVELQPGHSEEPGKKIPWTELQPPKKVPWVDLVPPKKVPWTELQPPKQVPWVELQPPKKVPWTELQPAKKVPWVELQPPKKVPWVELQPPKKVPWVDLVPPKKVPWVDLVPANKPEDSEPSKPDAGGVGEDQPTAGAGSQNPSTGGVSAAGSQNPSTGGGAMLRQPGFQVSAGGVVDQGSNSSRGERETVVNEHSNGRFIPSTEKNSGQPDAGQLENSVENSQSQAQNSQPAGASENMSGKQAEKPAPTSRWNALRYSLLGIGVGILLLTEGWFLILLKRRRKEEDK